MYDGMTLTRAPSCTSFDEPATNCEANRLPCGTYHSFAKSLAVECSFAQSTPSPLASRLLPFQTPSTAPKAYGDEEEGFDDHDVIQTEQPQEENGYQGSAGRFGTKVT